MIVSASQLTRRKTFTSDMHDHIHDIMKTMESEILKAHANCMNECALKIPSTFNIPGIAPADATLRIHAEVLQRLEDAGYSVEIHNYDVNDPDPKWVISGWDSDMTTAGSKKKELLEYLTKHTTRAKSKNRTQPRPKSSKTDYEV
mgnify:CR=1 FL=1